MQVTANVINQRSPVSQIEGVGRKDAVYQWSAYKFPTTTAQGDYPVFTVNQGNTGQGFATTGLTWRETSIISSAGQVPLNQRWEIFDIGVHWMAGTVLADAIILHDSAVIVLNRGGVDYPLGSAANFCGGAGLMGVSNITAAATQQAWTNGLPGNNARRRLGRSILLNPGDQYYFAFRMVAHGGSAFTFSAATIAWITFWCYRDTGIQG